MGLLELFILAVGLSMDAFAVAICRGVCSKDKASFLFLSSTRYFCMDTKVPKKSFLFCNKIHNQKATALFSYFYRRYIRAK